MRVTKLRREFGLENYQMIEKDAADQTIDLKFQAKSSGGIAVNTKKRVLQIGLQAANAIKTL